MAAMTESRDAPPRMPGWVKWPGIVLGILIVVLVVTRLLGIQHGPGMHMPNNPAGTHSPGGMHP
jgi:hypothetical protein